MLPVNIRRLFNSILVCGLLSPIVLADAPAPTRAASEPNLPARLVNVNTFVPYPLFHDVSDDLVHPMPVLSYESDELAQGTITTNTLAFTVTEHFTSHTYQNITETTADWNVFEGVLQLPRLSDAAGQAEPSVVVDAAGNAYVAWQDRRNGENSFDIYVQKLDVNGHRVWQTDVQVSSDDEVIYRCAPTILLDAVGHLFIVWEEDHDTFWGIYAQKLDSNGHKLWDVYKRMDDGLDTNNHERHPAAVLDPSEGDIIVVWQGIRSWGWDIFARRLDAEGNPVWIEAARVNTDSGTANQSHPSVSVDADGNAYVVWLDNRNSDSDVYAQKLNPAGIPLWDDQRVNETNPSPGGTSYPIIATGASGSSYIAWGAGWYRIAAHKLDTNGNKLWPAEILIDDGSFYYYPGIDGIAIGSGDSALVTWRRFPLSGTSNIYAQQFDQNGDRMWPAALRVNSDGSLTDQYDPAVATNANDDIRVVWTDERNGPGDIYMQRLQAVGSKLWPRDVRVNGDAGTATMAPVVSVDMAGNSHIAWGDGRNSFPYLNVYAQKLNSIGDPQWPYDLRVNITDTNVSRRDFSRPSIATSVTGTVAIAWDNDQDVFAQALSADGVRIWSTDVRVNSDSGTADQVTPAVAMDASSNLYIAWRDNRNSVTYSDIYMQKLDLRGTKLWPDDLQVYTVEITTTRQADPAVAFDEQTNSLYGAWRDNRNDSYDNNIYAQRLDLDGNRLWDEDLQVNSSTSDGFQVTVATAGGYAYVAWRRYSGIYVQKLASDGSRTWPAEVLVGEGDNPVIATDSNGYSYVVWRASHDDDYDTVVQRIDPDGNPLWPSAIRVNSDVGWTIQDHPYVSIDATGAAYVVWEDYRQGQPDIYAQKLLPDGSKAWAEDVRVNPDLYMATTEARSLAMDYTSLDIGWATLTASATLSAGGAISYYLSNNGGQTWAEITPGIQHTFDTTGSNLRWRVILKASPDQTQTPVIDWIRIKYFVGDVPPNSVYVLDENSLPVPEAYVYRNGGFVGLTDDEGVLIIGDLQPSDTLTALDLLYQVQTNRAFHAIDESGNFAFRVYRTSMPISAPGEVVSYTVPGLDQHHVLTVHPSQALIPFNLVVSVEWDATDEYLEEIVGAVQSASNYLYDLTDGQMALGWVTVYDQGTNWTDADIQISTKNIVRPHAYIGGITSDDTSHVIRVGRGWDGASGNQGPWDEPDGYRTLGHEFGHYALYLYDEYFAYLFDQSGNLIGETPAYCTGPENRDPATEAVNASVMDYQYTSTELSAQGVPGLWSPLCEETAQWQLNGESPWETLARAYTDTVSPPRWQLTTPADRGSVLAGPTGVPTGVLSLPTTVISNPSASGPPRLLIVYDPQGQPYSGAIVALYKLDGRVIGQGFTDGDGQLTIYGTAEGDTLRAASMDGGLAGKVTVETGTILTLTLAPVGGLKAQATGDGGIPHMRVIADPGPDPSQTDLYVFLHDFGPAADPSVIVTAPGSEVGYAPVLSYSLDSDRYEGQISFAATERGMGHIRAVGEVGGGLVRMQSTYRLQRVQNDRGQDVYSDDGNLSLHLDEGSLPGDEAYLVVMPPGALPGPLPAGLTLVGDPYDVTASGALVELEKPAILKLHYDGALVGSSAPTGLGIHRWDPNDETWQAVPGELNEGQKAVMAPVTTLGTYALLGLPSPQKPVFLPIVLKGTP